MWPTKATKKETQMPTKTKRTALEAYMEHQTAALALRGSAKSLWGRCDQRFCGVTRRAG